MMYETRDQAEIENKGNRADLGGKWGIKEVSHQGRHDRYPRKYFQTYRIGKTPMRYFLMDVFNRKSHRGKFKNNFGTLAHAKRMAETTHGKLRWTSQDNLNADQSITKWYFGVDPKSSSNYPVAEIRHTTQEGITPLKDEYILKNPKGKKTTAKQWYRFGWNDARGGAVGNAPKNATHRKYYKEGFRDYPSKDKYKKNPAIEIDELILFTENEGKLHNQFLSIMKNLSRKYKKGTYNPVLAAKLWKYWIDEGVIEYNVQFGSGKRTLRQSIFTVDDRKKAAVLIEAQQRGDVATGEYLLINPKERKMAKKRRSAKQLANDKRLGRMAKARATKKRGGRRKVTKRKTRRNPQKARPGLKKSHLWLAFVCWPNRKVNYAYIADSGTQPRVGISPEKGNAVLFKTKTRAHNVAKLLAKNWGGATTGVANADATAAEIKAACAGKV